MMNIKNNVQVIGHLGASPEIKTLENGTKLARFAVAINETYTNKKGEKVTNTQWHNVIAWGKLANIAESILQKGTHVTVDGKLSNNHYTDKAGNKRSSTNIVANEFFVINNINKAA
jgi:single-strand DNA-binding protein